MAQKEQELRLSWHAPSANNATTTLPKTSRSIPTEWSFKNTADSAKSTPCTEKLSKAG